MFLVSVADSSANFAASEIESATRLFRAAPTASSVNCSAFFSEAGDLRLMSLDVRGHTLRRGCQFQVLKGAGCGFPDSISGSRSFRFDAGVQCVENVRCVQFDIVESGALAARSA